MNDKTANIILMFITILILIFASISIDLISKNITNTNNNISQVKTEIKKDFKAEGLNITFE